MNGLYTILLLVLSNVFMTLAWYGHLRLQQSGVISHWPLLGVIAFSWCIAFFEYLIMVPANRIGSEVYSVAHLKILQECISLSVFVPFALFYLKEKWNWNFLWASLCIMGAVFFMFRDAA
jgi:uncharacterized protein (DUF486 family)